MTVNGLCGESTVHGAQLSPGSQQARSLIATAVAPDSTQVTVDTSAMPRKNTPRM